MLLKGELYKISWPSNVVSLLEAKHFGIKSKEENNTPMIVYTNVKGEELLIKEVPFVALHIDYATQQECPGDGIIEFFYKFLYNNKIIYVSSSKKIEWP